jgi:hypothetical protein
MVIFPDRKFVLSNDLEWQGVFLWIQPNSAAV